MTDGDTHHAAATGWRPSPRQIGGIALIVVIVVFALLNFADAEVDLLFTTVTMPLVSVIAACALIGFGAGYLFARHLEKLD